MARGADGRLSRGGCGGWGAPLERDAVQVLDDVREGYISVAQARDLYGVVIEAGALTIDREATEQLRCNMRENSK